MISLVNYHGKHVLEKITNTLDFGLEKLFKSKGDSSSFRIDFPLCTVWDLIFY
jgi:hypothetical protein